MSHIPRKLLNVILKDKWYKTCCVQNDDCKGRIEFHHNLIFGGRQVQELFAILPVCDFHHSKANEKTTKERLDYVMLKRATGKDMVKYGKAVDWFRKFYYLRNKYERK